jgi:hypothetical protein
MTATPVSPPRNEQDVRRIILPPPLREIPVERNGGTKEEEKEHDVIDMQGSREEEDVEERELEDAGGFAAEEPMKETAATGQSANLQECMITLGPCV